MTHSTPINGHAHEPARVPVQQHPYKCTWTDDMKDTLRRSYVASREVGMLPELAQRLGVHLYQLYGQAHRLGLSREIRKRG
jgi:hypothetical protein